LEVKKVLPCHLEKVRRFWKGDLQYSCRCKWGINVSPEHTFFLTFVFRFQKVMQHGLWLKNCIRTTVLKRKKDKQQSTYELLDIRVCDYVGWHLPCKFFCNTICYCSSSTCNVCSIFCTWQLYGDSSLKVVITCKNFMKSSVFTWQLLWTTWNF